MDFEEGNKILKTCDNFSDADEHEHDHDKDYEYSDKKEIKKQTRIKEEPTECAQCSKVFTTKRSSQRNDKVIHELRLTNCDECDKTFYNNTSMKLHVKRIVSYPCEKCDRIFKEK